MEQNLDAQGIAPGVSDGQRSSLRAYVIGLCFAVGLTLVSFWAASSSLIYEPGIPVLLGVLAIAQMGVHLVFFLHISSAPDQVNNFLALAFGIFVVGLVIFGSLLIMANLNHAMMPMDRLIQMQR
jgi:cytochrome o ubiquinol oxidase operon protein cyoD